MAITLGYNMTFQKGVSGNPNGRPKAAKEIRELARRHCPHAIRKLIKLLDSVDERTAITAAREILDRGLGKAPQAVTGEGGEGPVLARIERVIIEDSPDLPTEQPDDEPHTTH